MLKKILIFFSLTFILNYIYSQSFDLHYQQAYTKIDSILIEVKPLNFQKAVFLTENAYFDNKLNEQAFNNAIKFNTSICKGIIASGNIE